MDALVPLLLCLLRQCVVGTSITGHGHFTWNVLEHHGTHMQSESVLKFPISQQISQQFPTCPNIISLRMGSTQNPAPRHRHTVVLGQLALHCSRDTADLRNCAWDSGLIREQLEETIGHPMIEETSSSSNPTWRKKTLH